MQKALKVIRQTLGLTAEDRIFPVSALKRTGHEELLDAMEALLGEA